MRSKNKFVLSALLAWTVMSCAWSRGVPPPTCAGCSVSSNVTMEKVQDIHLYPRYPSEWQVVNLNNLWKMKRVSGEKDKSSSEKSELPKMSIMEAPEDDVGGLLGDVSSDLVEEKKVQDKGKEKPRDMWKEVELALKDGVRWHIGPESESNPALGKGRYVFAAEFKLPDFDPAKNSLFLHFRRTLWKEIYVNGTLVSGPMSSFKASSIDASGAAVKGINRIGMILSINPEQPVKVLVNPYRECEAVVAPRTYIDRFLVTTDTSADTVRLDLRINNNGTTGTVPLTTRINSYGEDETVVSVQKDVELSHGTNSVTWQFKMPHPVYWCPDNPHLYEVAISDGAGNILGKERFGFRDFTARNGKFYLNGKRIRLFGSCCLGKTAKVPDIRVSPDEDYANTEEKRKYWAFLKAARDAGMNALVDYGSRDNLGRGCYEVCDELGILFYVTLPAWGGVVDPETNDPEKQMESMNRLCSDVLYNLYNHPCVVMFSFGAELYLARPENLKFAYEKLKPLDHQKRPVCSSSGRLKIMLNKHEKDTLDFADDHSYWGTLKGAWPWNRGYFKKLKQDVAELYGADTKPVTSFETLDNNWAYYCDGNAMNVIRSFSGERVNKTEYVKTLKAYVYRGDGTCTVRKVLGLGQGLRKHYTDEAYNYQSLALLLQRIVEIFRQQGDLEGWGVFHLAGNITMYAHQNQNSLAAIKEAYPDAADLKPVVDITRRDFIDLPQYHMIKRCYSPELVSAAWFDRNLIAGSGTLNAEIYAINDTDTEHSYTGTAVLRNSEGKARQTVPIDFGAVQPFERSIRKISIDISSELSTGWYVLALTMSEGDRPVSENAYGVYVMSPDELACNVSTAKKVAFYGSNKPDSEKPGSRAMLNAMGLKYESLKDFKGLGDYQVLVIGANAVDDVVVEQGKLIRKWVESGGRLLCLAQSREDFIPWLPDMKIVRASATTAIDIVDEAHPMFSGLVQENFDTWSGNGILYSRLIEPFDESVVAAAPGGTVLSPLDYVKSAVCDIALGSGTVLLSQLQLSGRYGTDAVATRVANNMVEYILSDNTDFGWRKTDTEKLVRMLDKDACTFIDLAPYCNAALSDQRAGDRSGGWLDRGSGKDMEKLPVGENVMQGIPFSVLDPSVSLADENCIMLGVDSVPWSDDEVKGIAVNDSFNTLYVLHAGVGEGDVVYNMTVNYEDGTSVDCEIKRGVHIWDWDDPKSLPQALVAWEGKPSGGKTFGAYCFEWANPNPLKKIESIDFVAGKPGGAAIMAITGYRTIGEEGWEDKAIQKRKKTIDLE